VRTGRVAERLKALVLKTSDGQPSVGSNPTPSAIFQLLTWKISPLRTILPAALVIPYAPEPPAPLGDERRS
jgi:hypothetical protein